MKNLFLKDHLILESNAKNQKEAFLEISKLAQKLDAVDKAEDLVKGFENREKETTTGFEDGFAIPHARIKAVKKPMVILSRFKNGIEWKALDGKPTKVAIAIIIPEDKSADIHLKLLSELSTRLLKKEVREKLKVGKTFTSINNALFGEVKKEKTQSKKTSKTKGNIIAITACPTGVAHTYMAADKLEAKAKELGYSIKVETQGSQGVGNAINDADIKKADLLIIAADIGIDTSRFNNVKIHRARVASAIKDPAKLISEAYKKASVEKSGDTGFTNTNATKNKEGIMQHLMSGVSYLIPIVIIGGIFIAISIGLAKAIYGNQTTIPTSIPDFKHGGTWDSHTIHNSNILFYTFNLGILAFTIMIPILGAMIANSIAGRAAIAPALVVTFASNTTTILYPITGHTASTPMGFLGAIFVGLSIGYTVKWMNTWKVHKNLRAIMPIFVIPLLTTLVFGAIIIFVIGAPVGWVMGQFQNWIKNTWKPNSSSGIALGLGLGLLIGAMTGFDMGGPVNKIAFLSCVAMLTDKTNPITQPMGAMACALPVAPLGMGLATLMFKKFFTEDQRYLGEAALVMGSIGISEGAIPFAVADPKRVIPANVIGSTIAGGIGGVIGITDVAAHGGPIAGLVSALGRGSHTGWTSGLGALWTVVAIGIMLLGAFITAITYGLWIAYDKRKKGEEVDIKFINFTRGKGEGVLALLKRKKAGKLENNNKSSKGKVNVVAKPKTTKKIKKPTVKK